MRMRSMGILSLLLHLKFFKIIALQCENNFWESLIPVSFWWKQTFYLHNFAHWKHEKYFLPFGNFKLIIKWNFIFCPSDYYFVPYIFFVTRYRFSCRMCTWFSSSNLFSDFKICFREITSNNWAVFFMQKLSQILIK